MEKTTCRLAFFLGLCASLVSCTETTEDSAKATPSIYFLHVNSEIKYRFSKTVITSKVVNPGSQASEVTFDVTLPDEAFLSAFKLMINGTEYEGEVKEKEQAKQQYSEAKARGQSAGHIVSKPRDSNVFQIQVNVAAAEKVTFELTYRELLRRRVGNYEQTIHINPRQIVNDFRVDVSIEEYRNITTVNVPPLRNDLLTETTDGENADATIVRLSATEVEISYSLTESQQRALSEQGISGQFVVQYDIQREKDAGEILVMDGYFVHFLAPEGLDPMPMDIVFVLDQSGSMSGNKIKQLHESMLKILDEISDQDRFMLISFDNDLRFWRNQLVQATSDAITDAKRFIANIRADGSTDINLAMTEGLKILSKETRDSRAPVLVFLTDGQPTSGVTNTVNILENIKKFNEVQIPIFSLAFGRGADYDFTKKVAAQNNGLGKRIYEDSDAALQIAGFYQEISTVLMKNVSFKYVDGSLNESTLTRTNFNTYFKGSELIVAGQIDDVARLQDGAQVFAEGFNEANVGLPRPIICVLPPPLPPIIPPSPPVSPQKPSMMETLWAYLTIKQLLRKKDGLDDKAEIQKIDSEILEMSLKYQFVTPLTSMVVTLPDESKAGLNSDVKEDQLDQEMYDSQMGLMHSYSGIRTNMQPSYASFDPHGMPGLPGLNSYPVLAGRPPRMQLQNKQYSQNQYSPQMKQTTTPSPIIPNIGLLPQFLVTVSSVDMCFDLPLKPSKRYNIIDMVQQKNGCSMLAETKASKRTSFNVTVNKFRGKKVQATFGIETDQPVPPFQCSTDGIHLNVTSDQEVRVRANISGRQRKQYNGILSRFVNMKCKVGRRMIRKGKQIAKIKCRQRGSRALKLKAVVKIERSGEMCLYLNKKMVNLLNLDPSNYEIIQ